MTSYLGSTTTQYLIHLEKSKSFINTNKTLILVSILYTDPDHLWAPVLECFPSLMSCVTAWCKKKPGACGGWDAHSTIGIYRVPRDRVPFARPMRVVQRFSALGHTETRACYVSSGYWGTLEWFGCSRLNSLSWKSLGGLEMWSVQLTS